MALKFGTSGIRGLNTEFDSDVVNCYITAFIEHAKTKMNVKQVAIGGDLRESTPGIMYLIKASLKSLNCDVLDCGTLPTPALALYSVYKKVPGIMITGSHIPADRNGIKFYWPWGEILKDDELEIMNRFEKINNKTDRSESNIFVIESKDLFIKRYTQFFSPYKKYFIGKKILVYQHSTVTRALWRPILTQLGFEVAEVGRSPIFTPVDTETDEAAKNLIKLMSPLSRSSTSTVSTKAENSDFFAVVSSDGDGDRPFLCDEKMQMVRGDTIGVLSAAFLKADAVVTPVSSNSALEKSKLVKEVLRTKIGSPFVIDGMSQISNKSQIISAEGNLKNNSHHEENPKIVVGYEANGGLLLGTDILRNGFVLEKLPTRDSILPVLCCLAMACEQDRSLSELVSTLPTRYTDSDVLREFPIEKKYQIYQEILEGESFKTKFISKYGMIKDRNEVDGLRLTFEDDSIIHFRPSGNAPEFRCYAEASSVVAAKTLVQEGMSWLQAFKGDSSF